MMRTLIRRSLLRILALIKKEILTILMDKKSRAVLFAPIIVQCIIFGYGASYHLESVPYAIYNQSNDSVSYEIEQELLKTPKSTKRVISNFISKGTLSKENGVGTLV